MISIVLHFVGGVILLTWFAVWFLDQLGAPRQCINAWRCTDGRWLVQYLEGDVERFAVGSSHEWAACDAEPPCAWPTEPITHEGTLRYLRSRWAREEQWKRERDERRARRVRAWAKQTTKASLAQPELSPVESDEEPRVVSAFYGE